MSDLKLTLRKGVWQVVGTVKIPGRKNGVRVRESTGTGRLRDAEAYRDKLRQETIDKETLGPACALTFAGCVIIYLEKGGEKRFIKPILKRFGTTRIMDLNASDVSNFAIEQYGHLAPASVKRFFYTPLNAAIAKGCREHGIAPKKFTAPDVERATIIAAPRGWFADFFAAAHFRIAVTVLFLTTTGRRVTEACRLTVEDCLFDHPKGPRALIRKTKGGKPIMVPLDPTLATAMRSLMQQDGVSKPDSPVFGYSGRWSVNQAIERVCATAGIKYYSSHKLGRHAFASRYLEDGGDIKRLKDAGGWASLQIVDEAYGHLADNYTDQAVLDMASVVAVQINDTRLTHDKNGHHRKGKENPKRPRKSGLPMVGTTGIEPVTPTMSREISERLMDLSGQENKGFNEVLADELSQEPAKNLQGTDGDV